MQKTHRRTNGRAQEQAHDRARYSSPGNIRDQADKLVRRCFDREPGPHHLQSMIFAVTGSLPRQQPEKLPAKQLEEIAGRFWQAIARERGKARSGHRSYNISRHIALYQALRGLQRLIGDRRI